MDGIKIHISTIHSISKASNRGIHFRTPARSYHSLTLVLRMLAICIFLTVTNVIKMARGLLSLQIGIILTLSSLRESWNFVRKGMARSKVLKNRKKSWFKRGHNLTRKRLNAQSQGNTQSNVDEKVHYVRLGADKHSMVHSNPITPDARTSGPAADSSRVSYKFLRPSQPKALVQQSEPCTSDLQRYAFN